jgi:hypothetical protein
MNPVSYLFKNILTCISKTKKQREFEEKLQIDGVKKLIDRTFETVNHTILSKELAIKFVLQELDMAQDGDNFSQNFVRTSGFQPIEYQGTLEKFKENENELAIIELVFSDFLEKISNKKLLIETTMTLLDKIMQHWEIGKYVSKESTNQFPIEEEVESIEEEPKERIITPLIYDTQKINSLMEEYSDIIANIIKGQHNLKEQLRIKEFKQHMSIAGEAGNPIATVFCCFYKQENSLNLPIPINEMSEESIKFFIEILDTFYREGFSEHVMDYLEENNDAVWELANNEDKYMQYLVGLWYICDEMTPSECLNAQKIWYEQSAHNGFGLAIRKMKKLTLQE